jgi:hypothetical protein
MATEEDYSRLPLDYGPHKARWDIQYCRQIISDKAL